MEYEVLFGALDSATPRWDLIHRLRFDGDLTDESERRAIISSFDEVETALWRGLEQLDAMCSSFEDMAASIDRFLTALNDMIEQLIRLVGESVYRHIRENLLLTSQSKLAVWIRHRARFELGVSGKLLVSCPCFIVAVWEPP